MEEIKTHWESEDPRRGEKKFVNNGFSLWKNLHNELMKESQTINFVDRFQTAGKGGEGGGGESNY